MKCYQLDMVNEEQLHCEGESANHAVAIVYELTGKVVKGWDEFMYKHQDNPNVAPLPYPCGRNLVWQFDNPVGGKFPTFCHGKPECRNKSSCPRSYACTE